MKKHLTQWLKTATLAWFLAHTHTHTIFAQQPRWAVHNDQLDYQVPSSAPLPTNLSPNFAQNAAWDENNNLLFYFVDGEIFDKNGNNIWPTQSTINKLALTNSEFQGHSECIIVPRPDSCQNYYVLWTDFDATSMSLDERYLIAVELKVDINNNVTVVPPSSSDDFQKFNLQNDDLNGSQLTLHLNNHIAITQNSYNGKRFLFVSSYRF